MLWAPGTWTRALFSFFRRYSIGSSPSDSGSYEKREWTSPSSEMMSPSGVISCSPRMVRSPFAIGAYLVPDRDQRRPARQT